MNTITPTSLLLVASLALGGLLAAGPAQGPAPAAKTGPLVCTIDDTPGIGVEFDEAAAAKYPYVPASLPVARRSDGTMFHW